ncbi:MAG: aminotransferase class I/II-fold pyridoxal phosphate-dependent enzyme [Gammaproteobacteria bacterium]|nr:aminotransferase class I/II-fold pyridoxal phosphate-dependent enzyme [Gammaproteobacteria bacterium]
MTAGHRPAAGGSEPPVDATLTDCIRDLERQAAVLEPGPGERRAELDAVNAYLEEFLSTLDSRPASMAARQQARGILDSPIAEQGMDMGSVLQLFRENVNDVGASHASGRFLGYIPLGGLYPGALGEFLAAVTNKYSGDFSCCPGAAHMEYQVLRWIADLLGYPKGAAGNLSSGGSIGILTATVTARDAHGLRAPDYERAVVYLTPHTHHAMYKALRIAGLGGCVQRRIAVDAAFRMDADALDAAVAKDKKDGLIPWLLVGSAGTTDVGSIDPLDALAETADRHGLWFQVDAAYGGFFMLSELVRDRFRGIERSNSLVINPHKGLHSPMGVGAVLVAEGERLYQSHYHTAAYLQDTKYGGEQETSPADMGPELTRPFRALSVWLPLKLLGVAPFRAALSEKILLARYAYEKLAEFEYIELGPFPELSVVAFRFVPKDGDADEFNRRLVEAVREDGAVYLTSTVLNGRYMIRIAILSFRTHRDDVDLALEKIRYYVNSLAKS